MTLVSHRVANLLMGQFGAFVMELGQWHIRTILSKHTMTMIPSKTLSKADWAKRHRSRGCCGKNGTRNDTPHPSDDVR
jgi:hypothetical protein